MSVAGVAKPRLIDLVYTNNILPELLIFLNSTSSKPISAHYGGYCVYKYQPASKLPANK